MEPVRYRRIASTATGVDTRVASSGRGCVTGTCRGMRSWSSSSVALIRGSEWNRATIGWSSSTFAIETSIMP